MKINLKNKKILGFGEIMMRLTAPSKSTFMQINNLDLHFGGSEANVITNLSILGNKTKYLTRLPDNDLGKMVTMNLNKYGVNTDDIIIGGERLGTYFVELGTALRTSKVIYDRKYSSFFDTRIEEYDFDKILNDVGLIHISGITPALNDNTRELTLEILKECKKRNIVVSYDSNYRAKLWSIDDAAEFLKKVLSYVDIAFLGSLDLTNMLKYKISENLSSEGFDIQLKSLYQQLVSEYPNINCIASTKRDIISSDENKLKGYIYFDGELYTSKQYEFNIVDRIGSGDAFTSGILHCLSTNTNLEETVEFGTACGVLNHTLYGDISTISKNDISNFVRDGITRIKR